MMTDVDKLLAAILRDYRGSIQVVDACDLH